MYRVKEVIVVEGRYDKNALSQVVDAVIIETGFGVAWFLGSWLLGDLCDIDPVWLAAVSVAVQALAIVFYILCIRQQKKEAEA